MVLGKFYIQAPFLVPGFDSMEFSTLLSFGYIIFASLSVQLPHVLFRHYPKMTGRELADQYPELAWLRFSYPVLSVLWFLAFGGIPLFLMITATSFGAAQSFQSVFYILGAAIGSNSILHGGLALLTNVCPLPQKRQRLYVYDEEMQPTALIILAMGVFVIIVAMATIYFYIL
jgi:hypothetical protein